MSRCQRPPTNAFSHSLDPRRSLKQPDALTGTGLASPISIYGFAKMSAIPRATVDVSEVGVAADNPIADMMP